MLPGVPSVGLLPSDRSSRTNRTICSYSNNSSRVSSRDTFPFHRSQRSLSECSFTPRESLVSFAATCVLTHHNSMPESSIAPFLTKLQDRVKAENIVSRFDGALAPIELISLPRHQRVGSYPKLHAGVDVSLIGKDNDRLITLADEGASNFLSPPQSTPLIPAL